MTITVPSGFLFCKSELGLKAEHSNLPLDCSSWSLCLHGKLAVLENGPLKLLWCSRHATS